METKRCRDCGEDKPLDEFSPSTKNRDGRVSYCRPCLRIRNRTYRDLRQGGPPSRRTAARTTSPEHKWCPSCARELPRVQFGRNRSSSDGLTAYCRPCHNAAGVRSKARSFGSTRDYHLTHRYGITAAEFDRRAAEQGGVCAVCRTEPAAHVDHDHLTGQVRGLLCFRCNIGLGSFRDDAAVLRLAAAYVERHSWQKVLVAPGVFRMVPPRGEPAPL